MGFVIIGAICALMLSLVLWFVWKRSSADLSSISRVPREGVANPGKAFRFHSAIIVIDDS